MTRGTDRHLSKLKDIHDDREYYAITLIADENFRMEISIFSHWTGWADEQHRQELRVPSIVNARHVAKSWGKMREPYAVINHLEDMILFLAGGGNALIEKSLFESYMPEYFKESPSLPDGLFGFADVNLFKSNELKRAPTPKIRMNVLKRDDRRCRICGRRPDDSVDVELHVHHIRPWKEGGATKANNLITLCHTCHKGLAPHCDLDLFLYVEQAPTARSRRSALLKGIANYKRAVQQTCTANDARHSSGRNRNMC
jgi:hypothetical protein